MDIHEAFFQLGQHLWVKWMPRAAVIRGVCETVWAVRKLRQLAEPIVGALTIHWAGEAQTDEPHILHTVQTYARCHSCYVE